MAPSSTDYDDYLYDEFPVTETHPERLAAIAQLFGIQAAPAAKCRVLELGCGLGGNLVPMASELRESTFVGIDLSAEQIAIGHESARELGLKNLELRAADILELTPDIGTFDYILCHGVYSWVPAEVQARILQICGHCLAPQGIAYISLNTYPGWHLRGSVRDMLRREVGEIGSAAERVAKARDLLELFDHLPAAMNPAQQWLQSEARILSRTSDKYVFYEHLVETNQPNYFSEFAAGLSLAGLQFLGDAYFPSMAPERLSPEAIAAIEERAQNFLEAEQYMDLLEVRFFRRALICREDVAVDRDVTWNRLKGLLISTDLQPVSERPDVSSSAPVGFQRKGEVELETSDPLLKAALVTLAEAGPRGIAFEELSVHLSDENRRVLGTNLLALLARGHVEVGSWPPPCVVTPGARPETTALIRSQARRGLDTCTNLRHESIRIDRFERSMLVLMDGTRTWDELAAGVLEDMHAGKVVVEIDGVPQFDPELVLDLVRQKLLRMARRGMLIA